MFLYFDPNYVLYVALPIMIMSGLVQLYLKSTFRKWGSTRNQLGMNGMQVAKTLFDETELTPIPVERTPGALSDHFDPRANVVRLSDPIGRQPTVAALAVTAHELGHVQQYQLGTPLIKLRTGLLALLTFTPTITYICLFLGLMFSLTNMLWLALAGFGLTVLFSLLTLPVEFDASRRGMRLLEEAGLLASSQDAKGARQMLTAAGLTYLAAAVASVLQLLYFISLIQQSQRR